MAPLRSPVPPLSPGLRNPDRDANQVLGGHKACRRGRIDSRQLGTRSVARANDHEQEEGERPVTRPGGLGRSPRCRRLGSAASYGYAVCCAWAVSPTAAREWRPGGESQRMADELDCKTRGLLSQQRGERMALPANGTKEGCLVVGRGARRATAAGVARAADGE